MMVCEMEPIAGDLGHPDTVIPLGRPRAEHWLFPSASSLSLFVVA